MINKYDVEIKAGRVYGVNIDSFDYRKVYCLSENEDGTLKCYNYDDQKESNYEADLLYEFRCFSNDDVGEAAKYGKGYQYMIEQTLKHYEGAMRERVKTEVQIDFQMQVHLNRDVFTKLNSASRMLEESGHTWNAESEMWVKL